MIPLSRADRYLQAGFCSGRSAVGYDWIDASKGASFFWDLLNLHAEGEACRRESAFAIPARSRRSESAAVAILKSEGQPRSRAVPRLPVAYREGLALHICAGDRPQLCKVGRAG